MQFAICNSLLALLCGFLFFYRLADRDLWSSHEGRAAQDAQTILSEGCWDMPRLFTGRPDMQKPPLYYWMVAGIAWLRGGTVDAWAVRLPAALAALGVVLGTYWFGWYRGRPWMGFLAAIVLASAQHFTWLARIGRLDMPLTFLIAVALGAFYLGWREELERGKNGWRWYFLTYLALGAALLLKGPIGAILPVAVMVTCLLIQGEFSWPGRSCFRLCRRLGLWWGVPVALAVALPWYWRANAQTHGQFFQSFFLYHNVERALGGSEGMRARPWWFYGPRLALDFLPWSLFLPVAGWFFYRRKEWRQDSEVSFGLVWLAAMVVCLSLAGFKRADYLLPAYPGAALILGCGAERWLRKTLFPKRWAVVFGVLVTGCLAGWWIYLERVLPAMEPSLEQRSFAEAIRRRVPDWPTILFFRTEAHALAFHLGPPIYSFVEWEGLDQWAGLPANYYVVMPPEWAEEWPDHLTSGRLEKVLDNRELGNGLPEQPLVLMRTLPKME